jgi:uncharacterized protein (DUF1697 family)
MPPRATPPPRSSARTNHVALLRGINVGGKNIVSMADLAAIFADAGAADVRTYIQSGNVVFAATAGAANNIPRLVSEALAKQFKLRVPVIVRAAPDLARVAAKNPFLAAGEILDPADRSLHVMFLADEPQRPHLAALDPKRSPGDLFEVRGREIYLKLPGGAGKTRLTNAYFDSTLKTISTGRNWRTVMKLVEMAKEG